MSPKRKTKRSTFKPIEYNIIPGQVPRAGTNWSYIDTQPGKRRIYYHREFAQSQDYNYHVTVCWRQTIYGEQVDHHSTLWMGEGKLHYGWCLNPQKESVWRDLPPTDPKNCKLIELFQEFEKDKHRLLSRDTLARIKPPKA